MIDDTRLIEIFKTEYSKLIAVLCQYYGVTEVQLAEDIVSETFLKAMKVWAHKGVPDKPAAWLRKVAVNHLKDYYKRSKIYREKILFNLESKTDAAQPEEISNDIVEDSQLKMIFVVCNLRISDKAKICLALRILCGLNINEIAKALLSNDEAINKILYRSKKKINEDGILNTTLKLENYNQGYDTVLRIIYLLFNEGYYSSIKEHNVSEEICWEALRLALLLSKIQVEQQTAAYALVALISFHSSRIHARVNSSNEDLLFNDQDRSKWNMPLIEKGKKYLNLASQRRVISKYHLEAAIAFWHTTDNPKKWDNILQLYNRLLTIEYSPIVALNRTYVLSKTNSVNEAIKEANKLELEGNNHYYCLLAELHKINGNHQMEIKYLREALKFTTKKSEQHLIKKKLKIKCNL